jgi:hypothetical protein
MEVDLWATEETNPPADLSGTSWVILNSPDVVSAKRMPTPHTVGEPA